MIITSKTFANREKIINVRSVVVAEAAVVAGVVVSARVMVVAVVVATMAEVLIHFVLKLIFPKNEKCLIIHDSKTIGPRAF